MTEAAPHLEQLQLLEPAAVAPSLRLSARTRRVGLAGVAQARAMLAEQARRRAERDVRQADQRRHPPRHPAAA